MKAQTILEIIMVARLELGIFDMKKINISTRKYPNTFTIVDDDMFDYLNQWKWMLNAQGYAIRNLLLKEGEGIIRMHRVINNTPEDLQTDHINRNKLDNRRCNLRSVTNRENAFNVSTRKNSLSGHKGITWHKKAKKWETYIQVFDKKIHLGVFINIESAIKVREEAERKYFGEFAYQGGNL